MSKKKKVNTEYHYIPLGNSLRNGWIHKPKKLTRKQAEDIIRKVLKELGLDEYEREQKAK